jgi:hypothetical protein
MFGFRGPRGAGRAGRNQRLPMEAHRSYERFERNHEVALGGAHPSFAHTAAFAVAVMAAFLALAAFLSNEAVKEVVTGETHRADSTAQLESNRVKIDLANGNSDLLRVLGAGGAAEARAADAARAHEAHIADDLRPVDARLADKIDEYEHHVEDADNQHVLYEIAEVGLEVGIVLASVSIIVRRRWLLGIGSVVGAAGVVALAVGLLV